MICGQSGSTIERSPETVKLESSQLSFPYLILHATATLKGSCMHNVSVYLLKKDLSYKKIVCRATCGGIWTSWTGEHYVLGILIPRMPRSNLDYPLISG